jgi:hypothetical protein
VRNRRKIENMRRGIRGINAKDIRGLEYRTLQKVTTN